MATLLTNKILTKRQFSTQICNRDISDRKISVAMTNLLLLVRYCLWWGVAWWQLLCCELSWWQLNGGNCHEFLKNNFSHTMLVANKFRWNELQFASLE